MTGRSAILEARRRMQIRLTVLTQAGGREVVVTTPVGTPVRALAGHLGSVDGGQAFEELWCNGVRLGRTAVVGEPPVTEGAVIAPGPLRRAVEYYGLELRVVSGPDAGAVHVLRPGTGRIGRADDADIRIDDPRLDRVHARIEVGQERVTLHAEGPALVDGEPVDATGARLYPGDVVLVGDTSLELVVDEESPVTTEADHAGHVSISTIRRDPAPAGPLEILLPAKPYSDPPSRRHFLRARWYRREREDYERQRADADRRIRNAVRDEAGRRRHDAPDPAELLLWADGPRRRLWERGRQDPDVLRLRLGTASLQSGITLNPDWHGIWSGFDPVEPPMIPAAPVTVSLPVVGVLGVTGSRRRLSATARWLVAQAAGLHSPNDVRLTVLTADDTAAAWQWVRWLPHLRPASGRSCTILVGVDDDQVGRRLAELVSEIELRAEALNRLGGVRSWGGMRSVVVLDGPRELFGKPSVTRILRDGPPVGIHPICLAGEPGDLPGECGAVVTLHGPGHTRLRLDDRGTGVDTVESGVAEGVPVSWSEQFARALAPLRDAGSADHDAGLPDAVRLLDLLRLDDPAPDAVAVGWRNNGRSTRAVIGVAPDGPASVDLVADGPHALVAGITGSGKSELLTTLVASLALANRPDELNFVLVDPRGGGAFGDGRLLPHVVDQVTQLDSATADRWLEVFAADLRRRERLLLAAGCKDLAGYQAIGSPRGPLARLVIIVDEFSGLARELPDFLSGLVDVAQRGRSLGIHLVLATNRPGGVVSPAIRANTNLRIALRVADPAESEDVIDAPDASLIHRSTPGRGYLRRGTDRLLEFQTARVGSRPGIGDSGRTVVTWSDWRQLGDPPVVPRLDDDRPTDVSRLVAAVAGAAEQLRITARAPWLPPLPDRIDVDDLPVLPDQIPLGLVDVPARQSREPFALDLAGSGLAIVGKPFSGMTSTLRTLAGVIARDHRPDDVYVYAVDCGTSGGLEPLQVLPHVGAVVPRGQRQRAARLVDRLLTEVQDRHSRGIGDSGRQPWTVLLVHGWERFADQYDSATVEALERIIVQGSPVGVQVVATGDRTLLGGRMGSLLPNRLVLQLADAGEYSLAGLRPRQIPERMPPGRGFAELDGETLPAQIAVLGPDDAGERAALRRLAAARNPVPADRAGLPPPLDEV